MSPLILLLLVLAVAFILFAVIGAGSQPKSKKFKSSGAGSIDREFVAGKWATIEAMANGQGSSLRDAVSEADKLLDYVLKRSGVRGETMGERLKNSHGRFSNLNNIWTAHKLRNALAHEADFDLVPSQAREAVGYFRQGLKDLGAL